MKEKNKNNILIILVIVGGLRLKKFDINKIISPDRPLLTKPAE